ncbi:MAG: rhodanese-like domain-containing protein, partial [Deltaproteobacteria bacterium]|nr:rhodanese-like domain-containing protein [Deltaproteobacteria bacterium]
LTVVDCNSEKTRKKVGILPGAVLIDDETFTASELPSDKSTKLVFYCGGPG